MIQPAPRPIEVGGVTGFQLLGDLENAGVHLNEHAKTLLLSDQFPQSRRHTVSVVVLTVRELGLESGGTLPVIFQQARHHGLAAGPPDLAAHFRLQYLNQPDGEAGPPGKAPPGSITVASEPISPTAPRGFYLRTIAGELWLRGYRAAANHLWDPEDCFAFITTDG
jgi:hypothetical protein